MTGTVRIPPLDRADFTPEQAELVGEWHHLVFSRTIVRHPEMYRLFVPWIERLIARTSLPPRDRQILVLRTLALADETYELHHHRAISRSAGLSDRDIAAAISGGDALAGFDRELADAAEQLLRNQRIADSTWGALAVRYDEARLMEVVFLVGCYATMAMLTRSFGMPIEEADEAGQVESLRDYT